MHYMHITVIHSPPKNMHSSLVQNRGILQEVHQCQIAKADSMTTKERTRKQ